MRNTGSVAAALIATLAATFATSHLAHAQAPAADAALARMPMTKALVIERVGGGGGRSAVSMDAVQRLIVTGQWTTPKAGDEITLADGSKRAWSEVEAGADGAIPADKTRGGYALWLVESDADKIWLLNARGHGLAYVNGEPRAGDPYDNGSVSLPVKLHKGVNEILLQCPRGAVKAELVEPRGQCTISDADMTLPDLVQGQRGKQELTGSAVVINAGERPLSGCRMRCADDATGRSIDIELPVIPALATRKCKFHIPSLPESIAAGTKLARRVAVVAADKRTEIASSEIQLDVVDALALQKRTFISEIDGSVQYFAMRPALKPDANNGLILTLHGAGVEARGQAAAYQSKDWAHIVAATNRRPYGFDWEDWGRLDAIEVLHIAEKELPHDPQRVYLTGHSMGGHGTWQIGVTYPGEFAAIAPSAGWISFETYAGGRGGANNNANLDPIQQLVRRAGNASRTLDLQHNLDGLGVYILHGEKDDNVPVEQARTMKAELDKWHKDLAYHEQPGAGHWWGNECVDWPPLMEFLQKHVKPEAKAIDHVAFTTALPGVSASRDWVTIQQQTKALAFSSVDLKRDLAKRAITGTTENVARLAIDVSALESGAEIALDVDGQALRARPGPQAEGMLGLFRNVDRWEIATAPIPESQKTPARCGPFKTAFNHQVMFVYGTRGSAEENAWALSKARFDAESFWYRGNGSIDIVADVDFDPNAAATQGRSVIIYGNADTNAAWEALLHDSPVQVHRGSVKIGERELKGDGLACLFVRPRPSCNITSVGVVSGSGAIGQRITDRLSYFVSGVAYPDCIVLDGNALSIGAAASPAIIATGFFGNDWSIEAGDFASAN